MIRKRLIYLGLAGLVMVIGLASRKFRGELPAFLAEYSGDVLWALMVYLLISTLAATWPIATRAGSALAISFLVELSQLYHAPWIDSIRQTTLGGLVLGFQFVWTDLICYSVGIALGLIVEWTVSRAYSASPKH